MVKAPDRPTVIYDGECAFCLRWVRRWHARTGDNVKYVRLQETKALSELGISQEEAKKALQLIEPSGRKSQGACAAFRALSYAPGGSWAVKAVQWPLVLSIAEVVYRLISRHRKFALFVDELIFGKET